MASKYYLNENNCYVLTFNLQDENGTAISLASLGTLFCTQYYYNSELTTSDSYHLSTINSRYIQNIKNTNDVTVSATGTVTWEITKDDTVKLNSSTAQELHIALITWQWSGKQNSHEFYFYVNKVPYAV